VEFVEELRVMKIQAFMAVVVCACVVAPALADFGAGSEFYWGDVKLEAVGQVKLDWGLATNAAFGVTLVSGQLTGSIYPQTAPPERPNMFRTFCVENGIYFTPGTIYWASIDPVAYSGHVGPAGDPISKVSEYIYDGYLAGTITNLTGIRDAIWYAENEGGVKNAIYDTAFVAAGAGNAGHTYALNLWSITEQGGEYVATDVQSQLITVVPIPGAVLLGFLGLGYAGTRLRRFV